MDRVEQGIRQIEPRADGGADFSRGIMTTDTRPKMVAVEFEAGGTTLRLGGSTKGVGMIYPNMATMLCYLTTDAAVEHDWLRATLRAAVNDSFNMVCVDGDMSTNDSAFLFANGLAGNTPLRAGVPGAETFATALAYVARYLAREMARDGEGATHLTIVRVRGAHSDADARRAARAVTASPLWQCAVAGGDANWGRVIAALGASGAEFAHKDVGLAINGVTLVADGRAADYDPAAAKAAMQPVDIAIDVTLGDGDAEATAWGCDLTHGYIDENTTYTR
jgi:glutamate N-acetyltransferase/amino-acid N-acetyltransferase